MRYYMKLQRGPFDAVESGDKSIELRLCDEKRSVLKEGDEIVFSCAGVDHKLIATVKALYRFKDFRQLYAKLPLEKCGYKGRAEEARYEDMYEYYSVEQIEKYGALGIELEDVGILTD